MNAFDKVIYRLKEGDRGSLFFSLLMEKATCL
jgi:hypothetical protein